MVSGWKVTSLSCLAGQVLNYLSNTITNSNNYIKINKHRYRIFIDFWGRGWSETVRSVQIKDGRCHGVYLETYSNEFLDGEALILAHGRWLEDGSRNTFAEEDDSVYFLFDKYKITFDFPSIQLPKVSISMSTQGKVTLYVKVAKKRLFVCIKCV